MTAPNSPEQGKDTAAAVGFAGFMAAILGPVGLVLAAFAVATERAWSRRRSGSPVRESARRDAVADARDWLARDAQQRAAWRQARRDWWAAGADPDSKPAEPSWVARLAAWFRRMRARDRVWSDQFVNDWRDGWQAADRVRRDGGSFGDVVRARPDQPQPQPRPSTIEPATPDMPTTDPEATVRLPERQPAPETDAHPDQQRPTADTTAPDASHDSNPDPTTDGGTPMTQPTSDSNAAVMAAKLAAVTATTAQVSDAVDRLAALQGTLAGQVADAAEFATATGQTTATQAALDSANAVATQVGQQVGQVSQMAEQAIDDTSAAREGLRPVEHAEDALRQAGADGRAVAPAAMSGAA